MPQVIETFKEFVTRQACESERVDYGVSSVFQVFANGAQATLNQEFGSVRMHDPPEDELERLKLQLEFWRARLKRHEDEYRTTLGHMKTGIQLAQKQPTNFDPPQPHHLDQLRSIKAAIPPLREKVAEIQAKVDALDPPEHNDPYGRFKEQRQQSARRALNEFHQFLQEE